MSTEFWFATPIYGFDFAGDELASIQTQIDSVIAKVIEDKGSSPWGDNVKTTFNFAGVHDIEKYNLSALREKILWAANDYATSIKYPEPDFKLLESWFNFCDNGGFQYDHTHPGYRVSGVYYYASNEEDGRIRFPNPVSEMQFGGFPSDRIPIDAITYKPKTGRILLFPSWLTHRVNVNTTDHTRISIAFNLK